MIGSHRHGWRDRVRIVVVAVALWPAMAMAQDEPWTPLDRAPEDIERLMVGLRTDELGLPLKVRRNMLRRIEAIEVTRADGPPDRYLRMKHEGEGVYFSAIVRTFGGPRPEDTVYLLQAVSEVDTCAALKPLLGADDRVGRKFCVFDEDQGVAHLQADADARYGFVAYRLDARGRAHVVTRRVLPEDPVLNLPDGEVYGVHDEVDSHPGAWVDMSRLSEVPVLRLYVELGYGGGLPRDHPRAFSAGYPGQVHTAHFGFLVWSGQRFDLRGTVPRTLWPCTYDHLSPSGQSCLERDPDPFVSPTGPSATPAP